MPINPTSELIAEYGKARRERERREIPPNVYYDEGNFYYCGPNAENYGKGMGDVFYAKWRHRASQFPGRPPR